MNEEYQYEKVEELPPTRREGWYMRFIKELKQMPGQWVRLNREYPTASKASHLVTGLKYHGAEATARTADRKTYHVFARWIEKPDKKDGGKQ